MIPNCKYILLGDSNTGKSSIIERYIYDQFFEVTRATVGIEYLSKEVTIDNERILISIWDTAGQERFSNIVRYYYRRCCAVLFVYDVTNATSYFNLINKWIPDYKSRIDKDHTIFVLVANKIDNGFLLGDKPKKDFLELLSGYNTLTFEISAKTGQGVDTMFDEINKMVVKHRLWEQYNKQCSHDTVKFNDDDFFDKKVNICC